MKSIYIFINCKEFWFSLRRKKKTPKAFVVRLLLFVWPIEAEVLEVEDADLQLLPLQGVEGVVEIVVEEELREEEQEVEQRRQGALHHQVVVVHLLHVVVAHLLRVVVARHQEVVVLLLEEHQFVAQGVAHQEVLVVHEVVASEEEEVEQEEEGMFQVPVTIVVDAVVVEGVAEQQH